MISVDIQQMMDTAEALEKAAGRLETECVRMEQALRRQRFEQKRLVFFSAPTRDLDDLSDKRREICTNMRTQSLFLRESAKRYKSAQSRAVAQAERLD